MCVQENKILAICAVYKCVQKHKILAKFAVYKCVQKHKILAVYAVYKCVQKHKILAMYAVYKFVQKHKISPPWVQIQKHRKRCLWPMKAESSPINLLSVRYKCPSELNL